MEHQAHTPLPDWILVADIPPAAFVVSLVLLAIAAAQPNLEGLGWIAAALVVDTFALPLAMPCLAFLIDGLPSARSDRHQTAAVVAIVGNALTILAPASFLLYANL
jgi:hypothetical protein